MTDPKYIKTNSIWLSRRSVKYFPTLLLLLLLYIARLREGQTNSNVTSVWKNKKFALKRNPLSGLKPLFRLLTKKNSKIQCKLFKRRKNLLKKTIKKRENKNCDFQGHSIRIFFTKTKKISSIKMLIPWFSGKKTT